MKLSYKDESDKAFKNWEYGNVGFLASFNGKFFDGGYAKAGYEKTKYGERLRDYYAEAKRNLLNQMSDIQNVQFKQADYRESTENLHNCVIYFDPPYQNTTQYQNATGFDYDEFWNVVKELSKNNFVFVSELDAPEDFEVIWEKPVSRSMNANVKSVATEKLFRY